MIKVIESNINNIADDYALQLIAGIKFGIDELGKHLNLNPGDYVEVATTLEKCQRKINQLMHK